MDIYHQLHGVRFVWDENKANSNQDKHHVSFTEACTAFFDPFFIMVDATQHYESRQAVIGYDAQGKLLFVVNLEQSDDAIRIISARRATNKERRDYEQ